MDEREERIRSRAYKLWEEAGRPEGSHMDHWEEAERQIDADASGPTASETVEAATSVLGTPDDSPVGSFPGEPQVDDSGDVPVVKKRRASPKRAKGES